MRLAWMVFLAGLAGCAAPGEPEPIGALHAPIINGVRERGYPEVVAVANIGLGGLCSGTVIGPFAVMTAKHCVFDDNGDGTYTRTRPSDLLVVVGDDISAATDTMTVYEVRTTAGSNIDADVMYGNDIAILLLPANIGIEPRGTVASGPAIGETITLVGFGRTISGTPVEGDAGVKYRGMTRVSDTGMRLFETRGAAWTCQGDSGGPAIGAAGDVAGITSFGPGGCTSSNSYFTRVARHAALIADALAFAPPCEPTTEVCDGVDNNCDGVRDEGCLALGDPCTSAAECEGMRCEMIGAGRVCTRSCDPTTAIPRCPVGYHCEEEGCGAGRCVMGEGGGIPDGEACSASADCASFRCVDVAGSMRCARACTPEGDACATTDLLCELDGAGMCGSCIPVELSTGPRPFGAPCDTDAQCTSMECLDGSCTRACGAMAACPRAWHCREALCRRGDLGAPGDDCVTAEDCGGMTPECVTTSDGDQLCAIPCEMGTCEEGSGLECSATDAGDRCLPPGLALGEPCTSNDDCRSALCGGVCTRFCSAADPCPSGFDCIPAGSDMACAIHAEEMPRHRDAGGCAADGRRAGSPAALGLALAALALLFRRRRSR